MADYNSIFGGIIHQKPDKFKIMTLLSLRWTISTPGVLSSRSLCSED